MVRVGNQQFVQHIKHGHLQLAVTPALKSRLGFSEPRVLAFMKINAQKPTAFFGGLNHFMRMLDRAGRRLWNNHIQSGVERMDGWNAMKMVRGVDLDGVQFDLFNELFIISKAALIWKAGQLSEPISV